MVIDIKPRLSSHRLGGRLLRIGAIGIVLAAMGATNSSAAEDPTFPGLPDHGSSENWINPRATALNYVETAEQWVRLPPLFTRTNSPPATVLRDDDCGRYFPYRTTQRFRAKMHLISTDGAPEPYGYVGPFPVRTVAFGSIPVEATVQLQQQRDAENLPTAWEFEQSIKVFCAGEGPNAAPGQEEKVTYGATVSGKLDVAINSLKVDGVDLKLANTCRTETPGTIKLSSPDVFGLDPTITPDQLPQLDNPYTTKYYAAVLGGLLTGTVDVPAFSGCLTDAGEDVSRLVTATVSGPGNYVEVRADGVSSVDPRPRPPLNPLPFPTQAP